MNVRIVTVIPLSASLPKDYLDYFSTKEISIGDIVEIPIRKQTHKALVVDINEAKNQKAELKDAGFSLKAIKKNLGPAPFNPKFLLSIQKLQEYYIGTKSQIFSDLIPQVILENIEKLTKPKDDEHRPGFSQEKLIFQQPLQERISYYKTLIRESFAKNESIRIVAPTIQDIKILENDLSKGISERVFVLHSKKTKKQIIEHWNTIQSTEHPICIIHTPSYFCIPRHDISVVILEKENSPHYQSNKRPHIDGRIFVELISRLQNKKLIVSDTLLRTETLVRQQRQDFGILGNLFFRIDSEAEHIIVDMKNSPKDQAILSKEVLDEIRSYSASNKKVLLFALRSGLSSTTVCNDCGTTQTYKGSPLSLLTDPKTGNRILKSKKYNEEFRSNVVCGNCESWNLASVGIGTEKVEEILQEEIPNTPVTRIDQNINNTPKKIQETLDSFFSQEGKGILITSQISLPYLADRKVSMACIVSFDSLFNIPQFNMYEKIIHIIMQLSSVSEQKLFIQTRYSDQKISSVLQSKKLLEFFEYDVQERQYWEYPPFSNIVKMSYEGPKKETKLIEKYIEDNFKNFEFYIYHTPTKSDKVSETHVVLKTKLEDIPFPWDKKPKAENALKLREKLNFFPPSWVISINPQNMS